MARRSVLLLVAALIALAGTAMIVLYVQGIDARATKDQELVEVLVATETIDLGESVAEQVPPIIAFAMFGFVGALIVCREPANWIGWLLIWGSGVTAAGFVAGEMTTYLVVHGRADTALRTRVLISFFSGQPGVVRAIVIWTSGPAPATPFTMPRSTMLRCSSGSSTGRSASMISATVGTAGPRVRFGSSSQGFPLCA